MNKYESEILKYIYINHDSLQRNISSKLHYSLGLVNKSIKNLKYSNYLTENHLLTQKSIDLLEQNKPHNAIILAAGIGLRMTPINRDCSKGLLKVNKITLIENIIKKLRQKNIEEIHMVVGYKKEDYEYLIDQYQVHLIVNEHYMETNNVYSLFLAKDYIHNSYILPCDIWLNDNPFEQDEIQSWYLFDQYTKTNTNYKILKNHLIQLKKDTNYQSKPLSIGYINHHDSLLLQTYLQNIDRSYFYLKHYYWENIIIEKINIQIYAKFTQQQCYEIDTFEDLRNLDPSSESLRSEIIKIILNTLNADIQDIHHITLSKKGMTNRSFLFEIKDKKYMMRIPGEGTDQLINRKEEGDVYKAIHSFHLSDEVLYFNKNNGYKLTKFIEGSRVCNLNNEQDLKKCMKFLKNFHQKKIKVNHYFDIFQKIDFYESLRGKDSLYNDYLKTKTHILELKEIIEHLPQNISLTHIDAVPDNFLIYKENGEEHIKLIDWEYASMQDTDVDIAMFCIYAMYDKTQVDHLIDIYYENQCPSNIRIKIYCYIAICGLLWSNWCEYKHILGVEFGEYSLAQYRYAKEYYQYVIEYKQKNYK